MAELGARWITVSSVKGGLGRSLTTAGVGLQLARVGRSVLLLDWNMSMPGVHRLLGLRDSQMRVNPGLLDFLDDAASIANPVPGDDVNLNPYITPIFAAPLGGTGRLDLMTCGRLDENYWGRVEDLDWNTFYGRDNGFTIVELLRRRASASYDHVLVDSSVTGEMASTVSTLQLPDLMILLMGADTFSVLATADVALKLRRHEARVQWDRSPLQFLFVPSRIGTLDRFAAWLDGTAEVGVFDEFGLIDRRLQPRGLATFVLENEPRFSIGDIDVTDASLLGGSRLSAVHEAIAHAITHA